MSRHGSDGVGPHVHITSKGSSGVVTKRAEGIMFTSLPTKGKGLKEPDRNAARPDVPRKTRMDSRTRRTQARKRDGIWFAVKTLDKPFLPPPAKSPHDCYPGLVKTLFENRKEQPPPTEGTATKGEGDPDLPDDQAWAGAHKPGIRVRPREKHPWQSQFKGSHVHAGHPSEEWKVDPTPSVLTEGPHPVPHGFVPE